MPALLPTTAHRRLRRPPRGLPPTAMATAAHAAAAASSDASVPAKWQTLMDKSESESLKLGWDVAQLDTTGQHVRWLFRRLRPRA